MRQFAKLLVQSIGTDGRVAVQPLQEFARRFALLTSYPLVRQSSPNGRLGFRALRKKIRGVRMRPGVVLIYPIVGFVGPSLPCRNFRNGYCSPCRADTISGQAREMATPLALNPFIGVPYPNLIFGRIRAVS